VEAFVRKGDILIGLSTSGNSPNVKEAIVKANEIGMATVEQRCGLGDFVRGFI
jgi:D-sedoheptulose 7-phosphate isomerase